MIRKTDAFLDQTAAHMDVAAEKLSWMVFTSDQAGNRLCAISAVSRLPHISVFTQHYSGLVVVDLVSPWDPLEVNSEYLLRANSARQPSVAVTLAESEKNLKNSQPRQFLRVPTASSQSALTASDNQASRESFPTLLQRTRRNYTALTLNTTGC